MHLLNHRLAHWADSRLLYAVLVCLVAADVMVGVNWLTQPPSELASPAYQMAKLLQPMDVWGALFLTAGAAAASALLFGGRGPAGFVVLLPAALWGLWTFLFAWAATLPGASWIGVIFAALVWSLHMLAGLAMTYRPSTTAPAATVRG